MLFENVLALDWFDEYFSFIIYFNEVKFNTLIEEKLYNFDIIFVYIEITEMYLQNVPVKKLSQMTGTERILRFSEQPSLSLF